MSSDILYWVGGFVVAYLLFVIIMGVWKGWSAVEKIWFWTKKLFWILFVIAGLIFLAKILSGKNKQKEEIDKKIEEINSIETKTEADLQKLKDLEKEKKDIEKDIVDTSNRYQEKLDQIKKKPNDSPPGDAGRSSDDLANAWK